MKAGGFKFDIWGAGRGRFLSTLEKHQMERKLGEKFSVTHQDLYFFMVHKVLNLILLQASKDNQEGEL